MVIGKIQGRYTAHDPSLQKYLQLVKQYSSHLTKIIWCHICIKDNTHAEALEFISFPIVNPEIFFIKIEWLSQPSIDKEDLTMEVIMLENHEGQGEREKSDWQTPLYEYLEKRDLPKYRFLANKVKSKAKNYEMRDGIL